MEQVKEMTQEQRERVEDIMTLERAINDFRSQIEVKHYELSTLAPHEKGEIVNITFGRHQFKRAVLYEIETQVYANMLFYHYVFRPIKANGIMGVNKVYLVNEDYEWTGERYNK